jgi:hypothetical protein
MNMQMKPTFRVLALLGAGALSGAFGGFAFAQTVPTINSQPQSQSVVLGGSVTFTVVATGATEYQWLFNGVVAISGATNPTLTLSNVAASQVGVYSVYVGNAFGSVTSNQAELVVLSPPSITSATSASAYVGLPFEYMITASNEPVSFGAEGLPPDFTVNTATGLISGVATSTGTYSVTISATNANRTATASLSLTIAAAHSYVIVNAPTTFAMGFDSVGGIVTGASGNLYVTDSGRNTISEVSQNGTVRTTLAGTAGKSGGLDGAGTSALFNSPTGIAIDSAGNLYVADTGNSTIRKITPTGVVSTLAGIAGLTGSTDGTMGDARFNGPTGVAVDAAGNLYVADTGNSTVREITPAGVVTTLVGSAGQTGSADGLGSAARFNAPHGIGIDASNNIYIMDTGNASERRVTPAGMVSTVAASGLSFSSYPTLAADKPQTVPVTCLAVDSSGNAYVAVGPFNYAGARATYEVYLLMISPTGGITTLYNYRGLYPGDVGPLGTNVITAVADDKNGNIFLGAASICTATVAAQGPVYLTAEAKQHIGEYASVIGVVEQVSSSKSGAQFLNFDGKFPNAPFTAVVLAPDAARVGDLQQYEGKRVIVTGIITLYRGSPEIIVRKPEALKEDR